MPICHTKTKWIDSVPIGGMSKTIYSQFYSKNLKYSLKYLQLSEIIPIFAASNVCLTIRVESREGQVLLITPLEQGITILLHF